MGTNDFPDDPDQTLDLDSSDVTASARVAGGEAARQIGPYRLERVLGEGGWARCG